MKRHVKKYILIVLAMFVLLTITSCGTENRNTGDNNMTFSQMAQPEKKSMCRIISEIHTASNLKSPQISKKGK